MNINHVKQPYDYSLYRTGIAVGDYPVDHHHGQYPGQLPGIEFPPIPPYTIPLGCLIPAKTEGLIVCEKGISVTNIVNGTTRLQPVVLLAGQAAGVLAAKSIEEKKRIRDVEVRTVQAELLKAKCYLMPFIDVKPGDPHWEAIQKLGATGILKGVGKAEGWANKMFFYPDSFLQKHELIEGLNTYFKNPYQGKDSLEKTVNFTTLVDVIQNYFTNNPPHGKTGFIPPILKGQSPEEMESRFKEFSEDIFYDKPLSRRAIAVLIDFYLNPFKRYVALTGTFSGTYFIDRSP